MTQVNNKDIDNASGQVVRLDIQNTIKAVTTNNFGARNDAGTILPCEFLADDTTNKLLIRKSSGGDQANPNPSSGTAATFFPVGNLDEDNLGLLPKSGGTMTGVLSLSAGTNNAPSINFGDSNTGFYKILSNTIGITAGGTFLGFLNQDAINISGQKELRLYHQSLINQKYLGFKAPQTLSNNVTFTLPDGDGSAGEVLKTDGSGNLSFSAVQGVPTGAVFCMAVATVPSGYLECNGGEISRTFYAALFAVIGDAYGVGNGSTTFNLPDLRGEFIRGFDNNRLVDKDSNNNSRGIATSQSDQNKQHNHPASSSVTDTGHVHATTFDNKKYFPGGSSTTISFGGGGTYPADVFTMSSATTGISVSTTTSNDGGGETRPRNISMMYVIKI